LKFYGLKDDPVIKGLFILGSMIYFLLLVAGMIEILNSFDSSLIRITAFVLLFFATFMAGNFVNLIAVRLIKLRKKKHWVYYAVPKILMYAVYITGLYYGFAKILEFNVIEFAASFGIIGITIALSAHQTIQNYIAGALLIFDMSITEGDYIEFSGGVCKVIDVGLRKIKLRAMDGRVFMVPNSLFSSGSLASYTKGEYIRVSLPIPVSTDTDIEKAKEILIMICIDNENIVPKISDGRKGLRALLTIPRDMKKLEPKVMITEISKEKIMMNLWFWINKINKREVIITQVLKEVHDRFAKESIKFG
jgi:small-conductance mechanosensitive channel